MNDDIRRLLQEKVLREPWHEVVKGVPGEFLECSCGFQAVRLESGNVMEQHIAKSNRPFATPDDAQDVKDALMKAGKWGEFCEFTLRKYHDTGNVDDIHEPFGWADWLWSYTYDSAGNRTGYRLCELAGEFIQKRWE